MLDRITALADAYRQARADLEFLDGNMWIGRPRNPEFATGFDIHALRDRLQRYGITGGLVSHFAALTYDVGWANEQVLAEIAGAGLSAALTLTPEMFDPPEAVKYAQTPMSENDSEEHRKLALKAARETMVLLKNDGTLPLAAATAKIAVVGPLGDSARVLEGNYNGVPSRSVTALEGIRKQFPGAKVTFAPGTEFLRTGTPVPVSVRRGLPLPLYFRLALLAGRTLACGDLVEGTPLRFHPYVGIP